MLPYGKSCNFRYSSNSAAPAEVRGNTLEVYDSPPLKILWDFGVVCLNLPKMCDVGHWFPEIKVDVLN